MIPATSPLLTLKEVAPLIRRSLGTCYQQLTRGTFPIRRVEAEAKRGVPVLFTQADVDAYVQHGRMTNPIALQLKASKSRYFKKGRLAMASKGA